MNRFSSIDVMEKTGGYLDQALSKNLELLARLHVKQPKPLNWNKIISDTAELYNNSTPTVKTHIIMFFKSIWRQNVSKS